MGKHKDGHYILSGVSYTNSKSYEQVDYPFFSTTELNGKKIILSLKLENFRKDDTQRKMNLCRK